MAIRFIFYLQYIIKQNLKKQWENIYDDVFMVDSLKILI